MPKRMLPFGFLILFIVSAVCVVCLYSSADGHPAGEGPATRESNGEDWEAATQLVVERKERAIAFLGDSLHLDIVPARTAYAIHFLGTIHAVEAVPALCKWLGRAVDFPGELNPEPLPEDHPAYQALVEIGRPAVPGLLRQLATSPMDKEYSDAALEIIQKIVGQDHVLEAVADFRRQLTDQDPAAVRRLDELAKTWAAIIRNSTPPPRPRTMPADE